MSAMSLIDLEVSIKIVLLQFCKTGLVRMTEWMPRLGLGSFQFCPCQYVMPGLEYQNNTYFSIYSTLIIILNNTNVHRICKDFLGTKTLVVLRLTVTLEPQNLETLMAFKRFGNIFFCISRTLISLVPHWCF